MMLAMFLSLGQDLGAFRMVGKDEQVLVKLFLEEFHPQECKFGLHLSILELYLQLYIL